MFIIIRIFQFLPKPGWLAYKVQLMIKLPTLLKKLPTVRPGKSNGLNEIIKSSQKKKGLFYGHENLCVDYSRS